MSRINSNVQSLIAQRVLGQNNQALSVSLERLSTGLRINRGSDDPAGLIASENLRAEKTAISTAVKNSERAGQVVNIAEGGLQEISGLLNELSGLVASSANTAGLSDEERKANQLQIDSILQTIDRIASATSFQKVKLLNGRLDYTTSNLSSEVADFSVNGAKIGFKSTLDVDVIVTQSAQVGGLFLSTNGALNLTTGSQFVIEVSGSKGSRELSFASGTAISKIVTAVNGLTEVTGVIASTSGTGVRLESDSLGSEEFVKVRVVGDGGIGSAGGVGIYNLTATDSNTIDSASSTAFTAAAAKLGVTDKGQDIGATINGIVAVSKGASVSINTDFLNIELTLNTGGSNPNAQNLGAVSALTITGGGADFQLAAQVDIAGKVSLGIGSVSARSLGREVKSGTTQFLSDLAGGKALNVTDGDLTTAQKVVTNAASEVNVLRGRLGAFQKNTIGATTRSLGVAFENTTAAESAIRDADFARETAALTRAQILVSSTTNVLGLANSQPQSVLQLLG